jgi:predicted nucleotidyltransferase
MGDLYTDFKVHDQLEPRVWVDGDMRPEVKKRLLKIAEEFLDSMDADVSWEDVILVGSMANFNYSRFSDIDVHIIVDFEEINDDKGFVEEFMDAKKVIWNDEHQIMVRGHEVEMYVQDVDEVVESSGVYSILNGKWIKEPDPSKPDFDLSLVRKKAQWMMDLVDDAMESPQREHELERLLDKLKAMRKRGLQDEGEFSEENLAYKVLRRTGHLQRIFDTRSRDFDKSLSLESTL